MEPVVADRRSHCDCERDEDVLVLPEKPSVDRRYKQAKSLPVVVNGYALDLSRAVASVQKYEIRFLGVKKDGKEKDLCRAPKNDVAIGLCRKMLWEIYQTFIHENRVFFGSDISQLFYDCGINFYSIASLCTREEGEKQFKLDMEAFPQSVRDLIPRMSCVICKLLAVQEVYLHDISAVSTDLNERERSAVQFLEIATTQMMLREKNRWIFGNKSYVPPDDHYIDRRLKLGGGKLLVPGMQKNIRFIEDETDRILPMVQIDAKKSLFFDGQNLVDLVGELINKRPYREVIQDSHLRAKVQRQLKELVVRTTYDDKNPRHFSIFGITLQNANDITFEVQGQEFSVCQYFLSRYNLRLRYPELPCVVERKYSAASKTVQNNFYPMELLQVCQGQRVEMKKQTPDLVEKMIASCRLLPQELLDDIEKQRKNGNLGDENPYLASLGIKLADVPVGANATILFPPAIAYRDSKIEPKASGELDWRLSVPRGQKPRIFLLPATPPRRWVVFLFQNAVSPERCDRFVVAIVIQAKKHGMNLSDPSRIEKICRKDLQAVDELMQKMRKNCVEYILFITAEKRDSVHDSMKLAEAKYNVVTQHVCAATVEKALSNRGSEMTLDNLLMKMNLKLGGVNYSLKTSAEFFRLNRLNRAMIEQSWLSPSKMFVGLDMSHSSPQPLYERLSGQPPNEPTVVGMAFTVGECVRMKGDYWMQQPRRVIIEDLEDHMVKALNTFKRESKAKSYPEHVVVFRGGVSEGEYKKVIIKEAAAIRNAFTKVVTSSSIKIRLSVIVVQSNSNYRVFPKMSLEHREGSGNRHSRQDHSKPDYRLNEYKQGCSDHREYGDSGRFGGNQERRGFGGGGGNAAAQNVLSGTCVDNAVIHPTHTEFLLIPHKSIMGTARPIRCTVLVDDEPRMSMDELEIITYMLCYAHGIVTSPISKPAPLYSASDLAKRGRNNWRTANYGDEETASVISGEGGTFRNDGSEDFFKKISTELASKCRHKFWA